MYLPLIKIKEDTAIIKKATFINNLWHLLMFRHVLTGFDSSISKTIQPMATKVTQKRSGNL